MDAHILWSREKDIICSHIFLTTSSRALDRPDKAEGIEIYNVFDYRAMRLHWNGCGLILHEFCHLIHQFCLGLECQLVKDAYVKAKESGLYNSTPR
jgi:hypothetical protein